MAGHTFANILKISFRLPLIFDSVFRIVLLCHERIGNPEKDGLKSFSARLTGSDSVGIRTQDPQLRRLLLYPAELPDLIVFRGAKLLLIFVLCNI